MFRPSIFASRHSRSSLVTFSSTAGPVATGLCAPAALWAVDVGHAGRLGQAEADLVDQSAVVEVDPVDALSLVTRDLPDHLTGVRRCSREKQRIKPRISISDDQYMRCTLQPVARFRRTEYSRH